MPALRPIDEKRRAGCFHTGAQMCARAAAPPGVYKFTACSGARGVKTARGGDWSDVQVAAIPRR